MSKEARQSPNLARSANDEATWVKDIFPKGGHCFLLPAQDYMLEGLSQRKPWDLEEA